MARTVFGLVVIVVVVLILLGSSHLMPLNAAASVTRTGRLMHIGSDQVLPIPENTHKVAAQRKILEEREMIESNERMNLELNDYPGSGANNRHTPRPQFGRCADC